MKYSVTNKCLDVYSWGEIVLKNRTAEKTINNIIRKAVKQYRLSKVDARYRCSGELEYEPEFKVVYDKNGVLSYVLTTYTYFKGGAHGVRQFQNLNFDLSTGRQINFRELFDSSKLPLVDTLLIDKLKTQLEITDDICLDHYKVQLASLFFEFVDTGININLIGENYVTSVVGFVVPWQELEPFINKEGFAGPFFVKKEGNKSG